MLPGKRQIEQSLRRNGFSASEAKRYVAYWNSKGLLDPANWDQNDNFLPDMERARTTISDRVTSLLACVDRVLN
jgi:hypothetical protein